MDRNFKEALLNRRTYYSISNKSLISDNEIEEIVNFAALHIPSAFNSQSTRMVLLLGDHHKKIWSIVKETLRKIVPPANFEETEAKIDNCFAAGYGSVLFFEDQAIVEGLQQKFAPYADKFPTWSQHTAAMHQLAVWTMLEDVGFGASLQHYNPIIDDEVRKTWGLNENWVLTAQMPFGVPTQTPGKKEHKPLSEQVKVFK